jgi:hypothetical protein
MAEREVSPEQLAEEIRKLRIADLLVSTCSSLAQLGYAKLERQSRQLDEAKLAIEALRALVPVLEGSLPDHVVRDLRQVTANLQLAYAAAAAETSASPPDEPESGGTPAGAEGSADAGAESSDR